MFGDDDDGDYDDLNDLLEDLDDGTAGDHVDIDVHHDGHRFSASDAFLLGALTTPLASSHQTLREAGEGMREAHSFPSSKKEEEREEPTLPSLPSLSDEMLIFEDFIGQEQAKKLLDVHIAASANQRRPLGHVLLSGPAGNGKTTLAQLIHLRYCEVVGEATDFIRLTAPVDRKGLTDILLRMSVSPPSFIFIDEIHKMADGGVRNAEFLLHVLEDRAVPVNGKLVRLNPFTMIGGTTDPAKLPETIVDRFPIRPFLRPYTEREMVRIAHKMCNEHQVRAEVELLVCMARASLRSPRAIRDMVMAARDLQQVNGGRAATPDELLALLDLSWDGLTWQHRRYLQVLSKANNRTAGEAHLASVLHEDVKTLRRLERPLLDLGFVERTPGGRVLTVTGHARASHDAGTGR